MDIIFKKYLEDYTKILKNNGVNINHNEKNNNVAVIIEPREHELLELVVRNVMHNLGENWNLHIHAYNKDFIQKIFTDEDSYQLTLLSKDNLSVNDYNKLLITKQFWKNISEENILIFQTDSFILNKSDEQLSDINTNISNFMNFSYIGGINYFYTNFKLYNTLEKSVFHRAGLLDPYNVDNLSIQLANSPYRHFSMNGGFSFRKKTAMIECIDKVSLKNVRDYRNSHLMNNMYFDNPIVGEDIYFQNACELLGFNLPKLNECYDFCENLSYTRFNINAFGIHNINKKNLLLTQQKNNENVIQILKDKMDRNLQSIKN